MAVLGLQAPASAAGSAAVSVSSASAKDAHPLFEPACAVPKHGHFSCFALRRTDVKSVKGVMRADDTPNGYGAADLQSAYNLPTDGGAGQTVAIVDAFDDPNAEADLAVYREQYGLPACTTANGCFSKVDQRGGSDYPPPMRAGQARSRSTSTWSPRSRPTRTSCWSRPTTTASRTCPRPSTRRSHSVRSSSPTRTAPTIAAGAVRTRPRPRRWTPTTTTRVSRSPRPRATTATGVGYPAASQYVTAVGGTTLTRAPSTSRGWSESAWNLAGSGCSLYEPTRVPARHRL